MLYEAKFNFRSTISVISVDGEFPQPCYEFTFNVGIDLLF
jgi:hypothetical protein